MEFLDSVLIVGAGGREHALLKAMLRSNRALCMYSYPGNAGMENDGCMRVDAKVKNWEDLADWAIDNEINLVVVGPEQPLVEGIVDIFQRKNIPIFGPTKAAAQIEGSKLFAKNLMKKYGIPTAEFEAFTDKIAALQHVYKKGAPVVVKVSGLAGGKGVIVCETVEEAENALAKIFDHKAFNDAGATVILEEKMFGEEASVFVLTDGKSYRILPVSQDHKRVFDGDKGPNTGGMGAYAPTPFVTPEILEHIESAIIQPTLRAMTEEKMTYKGLLYVGIMLTEQGPKVIEYNCRFGDPETEAVLPLITCDWFEVFKSCTDGTLAGQKITIRDGFCVAVVLASKGYPDKYEKGKIIQGIDTAEYSKTNVDVYHAGTIKKSEDDENFYTSGGRVLAISVWAETLPEAIATVYENVAYVDFEGMFFRRDIGLKGLKEV